MHGPRHHRTIIYQLPNISTHAGGRTTSARRGGRRGAIGEPRARLGGGEPKLAETPKQEAINANISLMAGGALQPECWMSCRGGERREIGILSSTNPCVAQNERYNTTKVAWFETVSVVVSSLWGRFAK